MEMDRIAELASTAEAMEKTAKYLASHLGVFLKKGERVLICFEDAPGSLGRMFREAVESCGAIPMMWGADRRWKTLLRQAFAYRVGAIIAPPLVILGLSKLARAKSTPLYIRNVVTAGYPCAGWMISGIINGLDCRTWGCFDWKSTCAVAGFSCGDGRGVHVRSEEFGVKILDAQGNELPNGEVGEIWLYHKAEPERLYPVGDRGRLAAEPCVCGETPPRLTDITVGRSMDDRLRDAGQEIMRWTSVLDCRIGRTEAGLEIEIVVFPGEKLPKLPSCAKLSVRPLDPETDEPFWTEMAWKHQP